MLRQRVLTAVVGIPLGLAVMWLGGWVLAGAIAVIAVLGVAEFLRMLRVAHPAALTVGGILAVFIVLCSYLRPQFGLMELLGIALALYLPVYVVTWLGADKPAPETGWTGPSLAVVAGLAYVAHLFTYTVAIRGLPAAVRHTPIPTGSVLLFIAIGACWATDAIAYLVGRKLGKHKLAPKISPGKTVEGGIAGLVGGMLLVGALGTWVGIRPAWAVGLGALLAVAAQAGDLFESWLKRRAGVKDSGSLLPGHGGILDRFDSLLFVAPVAYYCLKALL